LEIAERSPGRFDVLWKMPALGGAMLPLRPVLPEACPRATAPLTYEMPDAMLQRWTIQCGEKPLAGQPVAIEGLSATLIDVLVRIAFADGKVIIHLLRPAASSFVVAGKKPSAVPIWGYLQLGVEHILLGIDHLLFVLALLLLVRGAWLLIKTLTAFTLAHSVTLALATLGVVQVSAAPVEAVIALSIVFLAAELARAQAGRHGLTERYPWVVAFTFGLLHGFGFAGALSAVGLPEGEIPLALLLFNLGVELGQLLFVAAAMTLFWVVRRLKLPWPTWAEQVPAYAIGSVAAFWCMQRIMVIF
jgi:HupE / UreJ protein